MFQVPNFQRKFTFSTMRLLFCLHGIPVFPPAKSPVRQIFKVNRIVIICFANFYFLYRIYKLIEHMNMTFDVFPLINAAVTASSVNSVAIQCQEFQKFSKHLHDILERSSIYLSTKAILRLLCFYAIFIIYMLVCSIVFPINASHWFDAAEKNHTNTDFLHGPSVQLATHIMIFIIGSGSVVSHIMLFCFICSILQQILHSIYFDMKALSLSPRMDSSCMPHFRARYNEAAKMVKLTDKVFSLFGLVGLGCVFARVCSGIHFYLNLKSPVKDSWFFIFMQNAFDIFALAAVSCFAASVSEESRRLSPIVFHLSQRVSTRNLEFHQDCLNLAKVMMSSDLQLTAWKFFPFTRRVLPTVLGVTVSYVTVIIQLHASQLKPVAAEKLLALNGTKS